MSTDRAKPWVGWTRPKDAGGNLKDGQAIVVSVPGIRTTDVPVVVTPLLPDDPRPGDGEWEYRGGLPAWEPVEILTPPFLGFGETAVVSRHPNGMIFINGVQHYRRKPALKTWRVVGLGGWLSAVRMDATSKDELLKRIADALEEVP